MERDDRVAERDDRVALGVSAIIIVIVFLYVATYSVWMIDVSFGALSVGGCVTHGVDCVNPMVYYHQYLWLLTGDILLVHVVLGGIVAYLIAKKRPL